MEPQTAPNLDELLLRIENLETLVAAQQQTIAKQQQIIAAQQKEITRLETALAAAKKNSGNSSKPPSSDIVKKKNKKQNDPDAPKRKIGAQPGHSANFRPELPLDQIDNLIIHTLDTCPDCGTKLEDTHRKPVLIQQIKLVEKLYTVDEHQGTAYWCPTCQCFHYAPLPPEIERGGLFDAKLTAIVGYLKSVCHCSFSTLRKFLRDVIGIKVSRGHLRNVCGKVSDSLASHYEMLGGLLPNMKRLNIDESSLPENGKKLWVWAFEAELFTLYKIDPSRGSQVLIEMLGKEFNGVIGCDYFGAYRKYMREFGVMVQFCLAHLIRDIKYLTTLADKAAVSYGERLRELMRELFALIHSCDEYEPGVFQRLLSAKRDEIMVSAKKDVPENGSCQNMRKRFEKHGEMYFTFITTPGMEPTNNVAERAIRFVTIDRLVTQGVRSEFGRRFLERMWSVVSTCEKQGRAVLDFLTLALRSFWSGTSPPILIGDG